MKKPTHLIFLISTTVFSQIADENGNNAISSGSTTLSGNIGIGVTIPDTKLAVKEKIHCKEVKVDLSVSGLDYVFARDYKLPP